MDVVPFLHLDAGREADTSSLGDLGDLGVDVHARGESKEHAVLGSALVRFVIIDDAASSYLAPILIRTSSHHTRHHSRNWTCEGDVKIEDGSP